MSGGGGEPSPRIDLSYPLAQLERAMRAPPDVAFERVSAWRSVITGMLEGVVEVGSRTPVAGTPAWVTPEVMHGGFATGRHLAGGPLLPHEVSLLDEIGHADVEGDLPEARRRLNAYHLSEQGRDALRAALATGRFRLAVPEEGALMTVVWLADSGSQEIADDLLAVIAPWCDRLRFYPQPSEDPAPAHDDVFLVPAAAVAARLREWRPSPQVEAMREALTVWAPMYDRTVALILDSVEDGRPFARTPPQWRARAQELLDDYRDQRALHGLCRKPDRPKENFCRLRSHLARVLAGPAGPDADALSQVRGILDAYLVRHGLPGSAGHTGRRSLQRRHASLPSHAALAGLVATRIEARESRRGIRDMDACVAPVGAGEAGALRAPPGLPVPPRVRRVAMRALEAPLEDLVDRGVLTSAEAVADMLPALIAGVRAGGIADPALRRLHDAAYRAFRDRRSLLLLELQSQVRFGELPWIAAVEPWAQVDDAQRSAARAALARAALLVLTRFPDTLTPNTLIRELAALDEVAGLGLGLTYELAADIFAGRFSPAYSEAVAFGCDVMRGTLYARYFDLPDEAPANLALACRMRGGAGGRVRNVGNMMIIEQAQILTTHNLAQLTHRLELLPVLSERAADLAGTCLVRLLGRLRHPPPEHWSAGRASRTAAYAWRQMLFFLSIAPAPALPAFLERSAALMEREDREFQERLAPVLTGLRVVAAGGGFDARGRTDDGGRRLTAWGPTDLWLP